MLLRRYPLVVATVAVGLVGLVLLLTPASWLVGWIISIFALLIAAREGFSKATPHLDREICLNNLKPGFGGGDLSSARSDPCATFAAKLERLPDCECSLSDIEPLIWAGTREVLDLNADGRVRQRSGLPGEAFGPCDFSPGFG